MAGPRLKVLYASRGYTTHDHRFLKSFVSAGWEPLHVPLLGEQLEKRPLPEGVRTARWRDNLREPRETTDWRGLRDRIAEIIGDERPAVVLAGPIQSVTFLATLARARPLVAVSWGSDLLVDADADTRSRFMTRYALDRSDAVFGDCRAVREAVGRHSCIVKDRIVTFPWGIDLRRFSPGESAFHLRKELGWGQKEIFISTRSWEPVYAIDVLLRAFAGVIRKRPGARLVLLGDGSQEPMIRALLRDLALEPYVHAPGRMAYQLLPEYFRLADVYVSSALSDGTSISLLEAMACGLPVVVSGSFGNLEWVEEGVNGALAKPGDVDSLMTAMLSLPDRPEDRAKMRASNVAVARGRADWDANFPALVRLVETVAHGQRNG